MTDARSLLVCAGLVACAASGSAQQPVAHDIHQRLQRAAIPHALDSVIAFQRDSVVLVLRDGTLTAAALNAGTWIFGPPTTKAEGDRPAPDQEVPLMRDAAHGRP